MGWNPSQRQEMPLPMVVPAPASGVAEQNFQSASGNSSVIWKKKKDFEQSGVSWIENTMQWQSNLFCNY